MVDPSRVEPFVGKKSEFYLERWATMAEGTSSRVRWNWAAAIGGLFWMLYRKLYMPFAIFLFVIIAESFAGVALEEAGVLTTTIAIWDRLSSWVYSAIFGSWGNYWYFQRLRRVNDAATQLSDDPIEQSTYLSQNGGTNIIGAIVFALAVGALLAWAYT